MTVADRIKARREQLGLTQEELARRIGYTGKSSISKIETSGNDITLKKISKIAPALDTSEAYLMGWIDNPDRAYAQTEEGMIEEVGNKTQVAQMFFNRSMQESIESVPGMKEKLSLLDGHEVEEAIDLYEKYLSASPQVRDAIALLLKQPKSDA